MLLSIIIFLLNIIPFNKEMQMPFENNSIFKSHNYEYNVGVGNKSNSINNYRFIDIDDITVNPTKLEIKDGNLIVNRRIITPVGSPINQSSTIISPVKKVVYLTGNIAISVIENGIDGQELLIIGGVGASLDFSVITNVILSAENTSTIIGEGDTLSLLYLNSIQKWVQLSYSNN